MKQCCLILTLFLLVGCYSQTFNGTLVVSQDLNFGDTSVEAGTFQTRIHIKGKKKLRMNVFDGDERKVINVKTRNEIKTYIKNDRIMIPASESSINFNISGDYLSDSITGELERDIESCSYRDLVHVCTPTGYGGVTCRPEYQMRNGFREVEFKLKTTTTKMSVELSAANDPLDDFANFKGVNVQRDRIYSYEGICR